MASSAGKKTSKVFVWILLTLLILGLAGFGANGLGGNLTRIGKVGDTPLDLQEYANALQREIQLTQQQLGRVVTPEEIRQGGIEARVRSLMISNAALTEETKSVGLSVGDQELARQLQQVPAFQGIDGQFDREGYELALRQNNTTAADFETGLRSNAARGILEQAVAGGLTATPTYANTLYGFIAEERDFSWVTLDETLLETPIAEPSDADLTTFHEANPELFETPELRRISYVWLSPEMLVEEIEVDDEQLRALYDDRSEIYNQPERRLVERLGFSDLDAANAAKAALDAGEADFETLVTERGLTLEDVDQGIVARDDLTGDISDAVFALTEPGITEPVETSLGPALFRVNALLAAQVTSFEDAREELLAETTTDRARRMIIDLTDDIDDLLVGGATLEEVAQDTDMQLGTLDYHAENSEGLAGFAEFRSLAARLTEDAFPEIETLSDGGIFAAQLDEIVAPTLPPMADIRDTVSDAWRADALRQALEARAETLISDLDGGKTMEDLELSPTVETEQARTGNIAGAPLGLLSEVFEMTEGKSRVISDANGTALVQLTAINAPDLTSEDAQAFLEQLNAQADQALARDVFQIYGDAVRARHTLTLDQNAINQVIGQLTGAGHGY